MWNKGEGHNVEKVSKDVYDDCSAKNLKKNKVNQKATTGPFPSFSFEKPGTYYFVCGVGDHCAKFNQKAKITVAKDCKKNRKKTELKETRRHH